MVPVSAGNRDFSQVICSTSFAERPQMIWVGFQIGGVTNQNKNYGVFENADLESAYVVMNNVQFPHTIIKADWAENNFGFFYEMQKNMRDNYLQMPSRSNESNMIDPKSFRNLHPIFCFDVSKQYHTMEANTVICELHCHFSADTPANLKAYIGYFNDRTLEMRKDGSELIIRKDIRPEEHEMDME